MRWLIDSDILIEGERGNAAFDRFSALPDEFATADIIRVEFLLGVHAVPDAQKRRRGNSFTVIGSHVLHPLRTKRRILKRRREWPAKYAGTEGENPVG